MRSVERLQAWREWFDTQSQRERLLLAGTVLIVMVALLQTQLIDPLSQQRQQLIQRSAEVEQRLKLQEIELQALQVAAQRGFLHHQQQRRDALAEQVHRQEQQLQAKVESLIPPTQMAKAIEDLLQQQKGLTLLALENHPVVAILSEVEEGAVEESGVTGMTLYRHSVELRFSGSFSATQRFFSALEALPWEFQWRDLDYHVIEYPRAEVTVVLETVSLSEEWIGV